MKPHLMPSFCMALIGGYSALGCMAPADTYESDAEATDVYESDEALGEAAQAVVAPIHAIWEFIGNQPLPINGVDLTQIPRYAAPMGPCYGKAVGDCVFDTRTIFPVSGHQIESVTAYGKYYNWDIDAGYEPWATNGSYLDLVQRYRNGPCAPPVPHGECTFDTRTEAIIDGTKLDSVTAYGRYWNWDKSTGALVSSGNLRDVDRYVAVSAPCWWQSSGVCTFDTREVITVNGQRHEYITAREHPTTDGRYWEYVEGVLISTGDLKDKSRYAKGPCDGVPSGECKFATVAFYMLSSVRVESITN